MALVFACLTLAAMMGITLVKEPQGGLRTFYKILFGFAFSGDGSQAPTQMQKIRRVVTAMIFLGGAGYLMIGVMKSF